MVDREQLTVQPVVDRWRQIALIVAIVGIVLLIVGFVLDQRQFWASYLTVWFWLFGLSLGGIFMSMIHYLGGGRWGAAVGDVLRSEAALFGLLAILFIPIVLGAWLFPVTHLYPWTDPALRASDPIIQSRGFYMTLPGWTIRAIIFIGGIWLIAHFLSRWFRLWDDTGEVTYRIRLRNVAGVGMVIVFMFASFGFFDWTMSLEPDWYSTMYSFMLNIGDTLSGWALMIFIYTRLRNRFPVREMISRTLMRDLGSLMVAMTILWAYTSFGQFMLIWVGNLGDEIPWYLIRGLGSSELGSQGWAILGAVWLTTNFVINFPALVLRGTRKSAEAMGRVALMVVIGRFLEDIWLIEPDLVPHGALLSHWIDIAAFLGVGGIWMYFFLGQLRNRLTVVRPAAIFPEHHRTFAVGPNTAPRPGAAE